MPTFVSLTEQCGGKLQFFEQPDFDSKYEELSFEFGVPILALRREGSWYFCRTPDVSGYVNGIDIQPCSYPSVCIINNELPDNAQIRVRKQPVDADDNVLLILSPRTLVYVAGVEADNWLRIIVNNTTAYMKRCVGDTPLVIPVVPLIYRKSPSLPVGCSLRIRSAPSEEGAVAGMFTSDLILVAHIQGNWLQVLQGMTSPEWMMATSNDGVSLLEPATPPTLMALALHLPAEASIRVRKEPFMDADLAGTVGTEQVVPVSDIVDGWARVVCLGLNGYMLATSNNVSLLEPLPDQHVPAAIDDQSTAIMSPVAAPVAQPSPALALSPAIMMKKQSASTSPRTPTSASSPRDMRRSSGASDSEARMVTPEQSKHPITKGSSSSSEKSPPISTAVPLLPAANSFDDLPLPAQSNSGAPKTPLPPLPHTEAEKTEMSGPLVRIMELLGSYEFADQVKGLEELADTVEQVYADEGSDAAMRVLVALIDDLCSCLQDNNNVVLDTTIKTLTRLLHLNLPLVTPTTTADTSPADGAFSAKKLAFPARVCDIIVSKLFYGRTPEIMTHAINAARLLVKKYPSSVIPVLRKSMQARNLHIMLQTLYCVSATIGEELSEPNAQAHDIVMELLRVVPTAKPKHRAVTIKALQRALATWPEETRQWIADADEDLITEHITNLLRRTDDVAQAPQTPAPESCSIKGVKSPEDKPLTPLSSPVQKQTKQVEQPVSLLDERPVAAAIHSVDPNEALCAATTDGDDRNSADPLKRINFLMRSFNSADQQSGISNFASHLQAIQKKEGNNVAAENYTALSDGLLCCLQDANNEILEPAVDALLCVQRSEIRLDVQPSLDEITDDDNLNKPQHVSVLVDILTAKLFHGKSAEVSSKAQESVHLLVKDYANVSIPSFAKALTSRNLYVSLASLQCLSATIGTEIVCPEEEHVAVIVDALLQVVATSKPKHRGVALKCISQLLYISHEKTSEAIMNADDSRRTPQVMELLKRNTSAADTPAAKAAKKQLTTTSPTTTQYRTSPPGSGKLVPKDEKLISDHYPIADQVEYSYEDAVNASPTITSSVEKNIRKSPTSVSVKQAPILSSPAIHSLRPKESQSPDGSRSDRTVTSPSLSGRVATSDAPLPSPRIDSPALSRVSSRTSLRSTDLYIDLLNGIQIGSYSSIMEYRPRLRLETGCRHDMKRLTDPATMIFKSVTTPLWNRIRFDYDDDNTYIAMLQTQLDCKQSTIVSENLLSASAHAWSSVIKAEKFEPFDVEKLRQSKIDST